MIPVCLSEINGMNETSTIKQRLEEARLARDQWKSKFKKMKTRRDYWKIKYEESIQGENK
jgi:hypothetical protein